MNSVMLKVGDCLTLMKQLPDNSVDAVITDPPYELGFMGRKWDKTGIAYNVEVWSEALRVTKPGAYLLAFGGTRTSHRMVCAIEDAGWEIRDALGWLYATGFPKSLNIAKAFDKDNDVEPTVIGKAPWSQPAKAGHHAGLLDPSVQETEERFTPDATIPTSDEAKEWNGWGTALKPAWEPIVLARKPFKSTLIDNIRQHKTGGLNINGTRIPYVDDADKASATPQGECTSVAVGHLAGGGQDVDRQTFERSELIGRWPANLMHDGSDDVLSILPEGAARFFFCAKAARKERELGCEHLESKTAVETVGRDPESRGAKDARAGAGRTAGQTYMTCAKCEVKLGGSVKVTDPCSLSVTGYHTWEIHTVEGVKNDHPTVKPIALMRYLCRLITPPNGIVLDPFVGSGTTACAAVLEGFSAIGFDLDAHHIDIAKARVNYWKTHTPERDAPVSQPTKTPTRSAPALDI